MSFLPYNGRLPDVIVLGNGTESTAQTPLELLIQHHIHNFGTIVSGPEEY